MTPVEIGKGRSFRGLGTYLLYGKADEAALTGQHSARVGWVQSYNLMDASGDYAWRLMVATADSAEALKDAAGIRKGKPTEKPVYHYSLNFNPADQPSEAVQRAAVTSSLKALGLAEYQALAVMHHDKVHLHIHVMVNLISPDTGVSAASKQPDGRPAPLSLTQRKMAQWAAAFEREHGLTITQGRGANAQTRAQGDSVDATRVPRNHWEQAQAEGQDPRLAWHRREQNDQRVALSRQQAALRARHDAERLALKSEYWTKQVAIRETTPSFKTVARQVRQEMKPAWGALFKQQREEMKSFETSERSLLGRLWNAAATAVTVAKERGALAAVVAAVSKDERRGLLDREHHHQTQFLVKVARQRIDVAIDAQVRKTQRVKDLARKGYLQQCAALKADHARQWQEMRQSWRSYNAERRQSAARARQPVRVPGLQRGQAMGRGRGLEP